MRLFRSGSFTKRDVSGPIRTVAVSALHLRLLLDTTLGIAVYR